MVDLLDRTYTLLDQCTLRRTELARRAKVGEEWLKKFEARAMKDPSVRRVQKVHNFLATNPKPEEQSPPASKGMAASVQQRSG